MTTRKRTKGHRTFQKHNTKNYVTSGTHHVDKAQDLVKNKGERDCDYDKGNISVVIWDTGIYP